MDGFARNMHAGKIVSNPDDNARRLVCKTTQFQRSIRSVHLYPFMIVVEKHEQQLAELRAAKRGTQWESFIK
jgi:hypothetical protein